MGQVTGEIGKAIKTLNFKDVDIRRRDKIEGREVFDELLTHFLKSGHRLWWWKTSNKYRFHF
jgi:hypothetical protein